MIPHTDEGEAMVILGVMFVMCYNRLPNLSDNWSRNSSMGNQFIKNAISRMINFFQFYVVLRWIELKEVIVIRNCSLPATTTICVKQKNRTKKQFQCPKTIAFYIQIMGGVDLSDQKVMCMISIVNLRSGGRRFFIKCKCLLQ